jgi:hypothetical protein
MQRDISERSRVAIDVERLHVTSATAIVVQLFAEEMRKV